MTTDEREKDSEGSSCGMIVVQFQICLEAVRKTKKNSVMTNNILAEIQTKHLRSTSKEYVSYINPANCSVSSLLGKLILTRIQLVK
jgi:hypothetical protein